LDDEGWRNTIMENSWNDKGGIGKICPGMASFSRNVSLCGGIYILAIQSLFHRNCGRKSQRIHMSKKT
jgi:hypothetical protein